MENLTISAGEVRRFASAEVGTNMYAMLRDGKALIVDPHPSEELMQFLRGAGVKACTILLTHEHPDHTWGIHALQCQFETELICQRLCAEAIATWENNRPAIVTAMLSIQDFRNGTNNAELFQSRYETHLYVADTVFDGEYTMLWGKERFAFTHTPGHSRGSCCIQWNEKAIFTGDSLMWDEPVITRLPGGSTKAFKAVTRPFLESLDKEIFVLPGHGRAFCLGEI